ncbi:MAG: complex I NDUFA9 subunit family protein [Pseudomonadota bacterium]
MNPKKICIIGGTGFVGSALVNRLSKNKHQIKVFSRHPQRNRHLKLLPGVTISTIDYFAPKVLERHFDGIDVVINLVGILNPKNKDTFNVVHVELSRRIAEAASAVKVKRLLHMSALNAGNQASRYLVSKGQGQQIAHQCPGVDVTIFCPSVIYGPNDHFFNLFANLLKLPGPFPVVGAKARFAPVYVEDVVDAFVNSIDNVNTFGKSYSLCGPKEYSLLELVNYTAKITNQKTSLIPLNWFFSKIMASLMSLVPGSPISLDNYRSMTIDSICTSDKDKQSSENELAIRPVSLESILPLYLGDKEVNSYYNGLRAKANR